MNIGNRSYRLKSECRTLRRHLCPQRQMSTSTYDCHFDAVVGRKDYGIYEKKHNGNQSKYYADLLSHLLIDKYSSSPLLVLYKADGAAYWYVIASDTAGHNLLFYYVNNGIKGDRF